MLNKILMKFLILSLITLQTSFGASTYVLPAFSGSITVNEFGICKGLTNSTSTSYMVPAGTSADWANFLLHLPAGINAVACVASNCSGAWGACSVTCGGGSQTYNILTPAANGGAACTYSNGATQACNTQSCCSMTWHCPVGSTYRPYTNADCIAQGQNLFICHYLAGGNSYCFTGTGVTADVVWVCE